MGPDNFTQRASQIPRITHNLETMLQRRSVPIQTITRPAIQDQVLDDRNPPDNVTDSVDRSPL